MSLHGLEESGFSFDDWADEQLRDHGWVKEPDVGPVYILELVALVRYVDDLIFSGPPDQVEKHIGPAAEILKFSKEGPIDEILSIQISFHTPVQE